MLPTLGMRAPAQRLMNVVFPDPDGPVKKQKEPGAKLNDTSEKTELPP